MRCVESGGLGLSRRRTTTSPEERVLAVIARSGQRRGLLPVVMLDDLRPRESTVAGILRGGAARDAVRTAMQRIAERESGEVHGWIVEAEQLDDVQLPRRSWNEKSPTWRWRRPP